MSHPLHTTHNQLLDNMAMSSQKPLFNIQYGIKTFSDAPLIPLQVGYQREYRLTDLLWVIPLGGFIGFAAFCIGLFYITYPAQLIWLLPSLLMFALFSR